MRAAQRAARLSARDADRAAQSQPDCCSRAACAQSKAQIGHHYITFALGLKLAALPGSHGIVRTLDRDYPIATTTMTMLRVGRHSVPKAAA